MSPSHSIARSVEATGEAPPAGFGHTFVQVADNKAILFGGTIDLSQSSFQFTNNCYEYDIEKQVWTRLNALGSIPCPRAAHAADKIGNNLMIMFGGTGSSEKGLCNDDLFLLDCNKIEPVWIILHPKGPKPGPRYGHTVVYNNPYVIVFGGHTGDEALNDTWLINLDKKKQLAWEKIGSPDVSLFPPRVYHSAALCLAGVSKGMMVVFGGRNSQSEIVESAWGLRRHRDDNWDWVPAPCRKHSTFPTPSYQHSAHFIGSLLLIIGGRAPKEGTSLLESLIYDTKSTEWSKGAPIDRNRHVSFFDSRAQKIYVYGGFERGKKKPCDKLSVIESLSRILPELSLSSPQEKMVIPKITISNTEGEQRIRTPVSARKGSLHTKSPSQNDKYLNSPDAGFKKLRFDSPSVYIANSPKTIRLADQAMVAVNYGPKASPEGYIKEIPLNDLAKEKKRMGRVVNRHLSLHEFVNHNRDIADYFIELLLRWNGDYDENHVINRPVSLKEWYFAEGENLLILLQNVKEVIIQEKGLLRLSSPIKIFGSLEGNLRQLRRIFENFGYPDNNPISNGDIEKFDYLFLGNIIDRDLSNPDMLILLLALKLKYPDHIYLLLGEGELRQVSQKISPFDRRDVNNFERFSEVLKEIFNYLPVAATIDNRIFCSHSVPRGGIKLSDLEFLERPLHPERLALVGELILSQFKEREDSLSEKKSKYVGKAKIKEFLVDNRLEIIIKGKEGALRKGCAQDMNGSLLTLVSGTYNSPSSSGYGFIKIKKNFEISLEAISYNTEETVLIPSAKYKSTDYTPRINTLEIFKKEEMFPSPSKGFKTMH